MFRRNNPFLLSAGVLLLAGLSFPAGARVVNCTASAFHVWRAPRDTPNPLAISCCHAREESPRRWIAGSGNSLTLFLSTGVTSHVTEHSAAGPDFSEALLLIDEPNRGYPNGPPPLRCSIAETSARQTTARSAPESARSPAPVIPPKPTTAPSSRPSAPAQ
jgi:hypothetical protein